jgi:hypothetical protein
MGGLFIAIGIAFATSRRFRELAMGYTGQGAMWTKLLGPRLAPLAAKYIFSLISIAVGASVIYAGIYGYD